MAVSLTPQSARVPIGYMDSDGQRVPVFITPEWYRFISVDLFQRAGSFTAMNNAELEEAVSSLSVTPAGNSFMPPDDPLLPTVQHHVPADTPPDGRVQALEAEIAVLRSAINDLQQGYQL